jgi:hypothetical protein
MELPTDSTDEALFFAATSVTVGNGKTAQFWTSSWINGLSPASLFPALYASSKRKWRTAAEGMCNKNWIRDIMDGLAVPLIHDYVQL